GNFASLTNVKMDVFYDGTNDVIKADTADIGGNIDIFAGVGTYDNKEFHLIITSGTPNLNGVFTSSSVSKADHGYFTYELRYEDGIVKLLINGVSQTNFSALSPLTYNQSETARAFDNLSANPGLWQQILNEMTIKQNSGTDSEIAEIKEFLTETSGYFLSNIIRNMAADSPNNEVYDKIRNHREEHRTNSGLWVQLKGGIESFKEDENSIEDYKDTSMGVMFGFDRFLADKFAGADVMWGVYGRINKDNIEQGSGHRADGNKNGLGVYGGYLRDSWELKGMLLGSYDRFSTERMTFGGDKAKADINAVTVSADLEAALLVVLTENIYFKPYAGIEAQNTMYEGFKETGAGMYNLEVSAGNYLRSAGRLGLGLDYEKGRWIWYGNVEGKYMIAGTNHEINSSFEQMGVEFYSRSSEEGKIQLGTGLGGEVRIGQNWKAFINGKYYAADRYENLYGNVGVRYMFGKKKNGAKEAVREAKLSAEEAERLAEEALIKSKEALSKVEEAKELGKDIGSKGSTGDKVAKEAIYAVKIAAAKEVIEMAEDGINKADEAIRKGEEVQTKVETARINKARATEEGYGITKAEKAELDSIEMSSERALNKAEEAKKNAMRAKAEAKILLLALERERDRNEALERQRQEAMIKKEISDADLAKQKAEAEERRKRPMLKTYTLTANFKPGSYLLTEEFRAQIREIAQGLARYDYKNITIEGHTDNTGRLEVNKRLSRQRARSVYDEFIKAGIPTERISYAGFADSMPIKSNNTAAGRAANRRTEIFIE
ncbi:MAG: autotransporter domain-containing protein, partial [Endomicrobia bacterium]|nr:autotransporter domain-containing protein [Endomicrobiia bacterium]